ncbi:MAG: fused MFS/spermidine synthase [Bacillota bacterium]
MTVPRIAPSIDVSEERGVRFLHFGSPWVQGAMRIARPDALELEYTREMMFPLLLHDAAWPASVLQIGLGAASHTRFLARHRPRARLTVVEIDPNVIACARQFFKLPEASPRLNIVVGDGADHVAATDRRFDLILVDGFDAKGRSGRLDTLPFYMDCRARLATGGAISVNLVTRNRSAVPSMARLRHAFGERARLLAPSEPGNQIALAMTGPLRHEAFADLRQAAERLRREIGLDLRPTLARLRPSLKGRRETFTL